MGPKGAVCVLMAVEPHLPGGCLWNVMGPEESRGDPEKSGATGQCTHQCVSSGVLSSGSSWCKPCCSPRSRTGGSASSSGRATPSGAVGPPRAWQRHLESHSRCSEGAPEAPRFPRVPAGTACPAGSGPNASSAPSLRLGRDSLFLWVREGGRPALRGTVLAVALDLHGAHGTGVNFHCRRNRDPVRIQAGSCSRNRRPAYQGGSRPPGQQQQAQVPGQRTPITTPPPPRSAPPLHPLESPGTKTQRDNLVLGTEGATPLPMHGGSLLGGLPYLSFFSGGISLPRHCQARQGIFSPQGSLQAVSSPAFLFCPVVSPATPPQERQLRPGLHSLRCPHGSHVQRRPPALQPPPPRST